MRKLPNKKSSLNEQLENIESQEPTSSSYFAQMKSRFTVLTDFFRDDSKKMSVLGAVFFVLIFVGLVSSVSLLQVNQDIRQQASTGLSGYTLSTQEKIDACAASLFEQQINPYDASEELCDRYWLFDYEECECRPVDTEDGFDIDLVTGEETNNQYTNKYCAIHSTDTYECWVDERSPTYCDSFTGYGGQKQSGVSFDTLALAEGYCYERYFNLSGQRPEYCVRLDIENDCNEQWLEIYRAEDCEAYARENEVHNSVWVGSPSDSTNTYPLCIAALSQQKSRIVNEHNQRNEEHALGAGARVASCAESLVQQQIDPYNATEELCNDYWLFDYEECECRPVYPPNESTDINLITGVGTNNQYTNKYCALYSSETDTCKVEERSAVYCDSFSSFGNGTNFGVSFDTYDRAVGYCARNYGVSESPVGVDECGEYLSSVEIDPYNATAELCDDFWLFDYEECECRPVDTDTGVDIELITGEGTNNQYTNKFCAIYSTTTGGCRVEERSRDYCDSFTGYGDTKESGYSFDTYAGAVGYCDTEFGVTVSGQEKAVEDQNNPIGTVTINAREDNQDSAQNGPAQVETFNNENDPTQNVEQQPSFQTTQSPQQQNPIISTFSRILSFFGF